jgi:hypothetical protein
MGCGALAVTKEVADRLKLELYDDDRLQQEAVSMGYSSEDLKAFDEKAPGLFDRLLRRFMKWHVAGKGLSSDMDHFIF